MSVIKHAIITELLAGYSIFRRDRLGRTGGGVLVAVKETIHTKRCYDVERNNVEFVIVELFQENMKSILLYTFYRPPNSLLDSIQQLNSSLDDNLESACILLTGDFNLPAIDWSLDHPSPTSTGGHLEDKFFDYECGNFEQLWNALTNTTFEDMPSGNIDHHWNCWKEWFLMHVKNYIPMKVVTDTNSPPWIDGEIRLLLPKKYAALKRFQQSQTNARKQKLRTLSQSVKYLVRQKHCDYLEKVKDSFAENPKLFWRYHKSVHHHRVSNGPEIVYNGETAKTAAHKAELFNMYFCVFTSPQSSTNLEAVTRLHPLRTELQRSDIVISVDEVTDYLDTSKASGPNGIPSRPLNEFAGQIAPSLCNIFNHSLQSG
ncbi:Hypothetical predicted protein [Paramuricea clavata]|uniref:Uncharacterized protein n=1 Tax=Paramuricea clavata TaxID=317549 RepID=A0A6S7HPG8_PARCT|nr:Hypothetical predicted protein [Paramuricea clavata]